MYIGKLQVLTSLIYISKYIDIYMNDHIDILCDICTGKLQVLTSLVHDGEHSLEKMQRGSVKGGGPETGLSGPMSLFENDDGMYMFMYICVCV
jgi:hypothetical protein